MLFSINKNPSSTHSPLFGTPKERKGTFTVAHAPTRPFKCRASCSHSQPHERVRFRSVSDDHLLPFAQWLPLSPQMCHPHRRSSQTVAPPHVHKTIKPSPSKLPRMLLPWNKAIHTSAINAVCVGVADQPHHRQTFSSCIYPVGWGGLWGAVLVVCRSTYFRTVGSLACVHAGSTPRVGQPRSRRVRACSNHRQAQARRTA